MNKREIQRKRTMSYFIDAAAKMLEEEGKDAITIRRVANLAGYNSATLYNYFENLDHLIFYAAMRFIKDYAHSLHSYVKDSDNALEKFLAIWDRFCYYSFSKPEIYYAIFFAKLNNSLEDYTEEYYKLFPEDLGSQPKDISTMLLKHDIYERDLIILENCIQEGFFRDEDKDEINEMTLLMYQGILLKVINKKINKEEAIERAMKYIKKIIDMYRI